MHSFQFLERAKAEVLVMELIHVICQRLQTRDSAYRVFVGPSARFSLLLDYGEPRLNPFVEPLQVLIDISWRLWHLGLPI